MQVARHLARMQLPSSYIGMHVRRGHKVSLAAPLPLPPSLPSLSLSLSRESARKGAYVCLFSSRAFTSTRVRRGGKLTRPTTSVSYVR